MSFKDELEEILAKYGNYQTVKKDWDKYKGAEQFEIVGGNAELLETALTSIINLVDKEQLRLKANDVHIGQLMQENDEMRQAIRTLIKYGELS